MIEVEIRGSIAKKDFERMTKLLETAGSLVRTDRRVILSYTDRGFNNREVRLEQKNGLPVIYIQTGKIGERKETRVGLAPDGFKNAMEMFAELGYKKGIVSAQEVFSAQYGGADFSFFDPGEDSFYYEAVIHAKGATDAKEAKQKLEKLARQFKLPIWTPLDMLAFIRKVQESTNYVYDYGADGIDFFYERNF